MAEIAAIRVLNVSNAWESDKITSQGVKLTEHWVTFDVEGGQIHVTHSPDIDIPVGWSGRALVNCFVRSYDWVDSQGKQRKRFYLSPSSVLSFEKAYKHPDLSDIIPSVNTK